MRKHGLVLFILILAGALALSGCSVRQTYEVDNPIGSGGNGGGSGSLDDVIEHFRDNGFVIGDRLPMLADFISAEEGIKFEVNGQEIEIYLYDPDTASVETLAMLEDARTTGEGAIFGPDTPKVPTIMNGNIMLITHQFHPDVNEIVEVFNSFK